MARGIVIGGKPFSTIAEAEARVRKILEHWPPGKPLDGEDLELAVALLDRHPNYDAIVCEGVRDIVVEEIHGGKRRFLAIRLDRSWRDFSWRPALYPKTPRTTVMKACRNAVADQIRQFRDRAFKSVPWQKCPIIGWPICAADCDVDHIAPDTFESLVDGWLESANLDPASLVFIPSAGYEQPDRWQNAALEAAWQGYHRQHARLRVVHPFANRSALRRATA